MKASIKTLILLAALCVVASFQSCIDEDPIIVVGYNLYFTAVNLSLDEEGQNKAKSVGPYITTTITLGITVNGETTSQSFSTTSNELLVLSDNEIEITFYPSCEEETEATLSLPDGTTHKITKSNPSFRWRVPNNINKSMEIRGESHYKRKGSECREAGLIILTPIK